MKRFILIAAAFAAIIGMAAWTAADANQALRIGRGYFKTYGTTTQTNTVTNYHTIDGWFIDKNDLSLHVKHDSVSGNGTTTLTFEAANDVTAASPTWVPVTVTDAADGSSVTSVAWTASANKVYHITATEGRYRLKFVHSGTGVDNVTTNLIVK